MNLNRPEDNPNATLLRGRLEPAATRHGRRRRLRGGRLPQREGIAPSFEEKFNNRTGGPREMLALQGLPVSSMRLPSAPSVS